MYYINNLIDAFLQKELKKTSPIQYYQVTTLIKLIFFCIVLASLSISYYLYENELLNIQALAIFLSGFILIIVIRFVRSTWALGTLICSVIVAACLIEMPHTGGVFSDTLHWLVLVPLVALVLSGKKQALMWLFGFFFYLGYLCYDSYNNIDLMFEGLKRYNSIYTYVNCFLVLVCAYKIADMQLNTQQMIIAELNKKNAELEKQKEELQRKEEELSKTNKELEHFAYAASHDMKEPMRMIGMYTQLMNKRIKSVEIENKDEFMGYITDGVQRMENMLDDLLTYSRIGKTAERKLVNIKDLLFLVKRNLALKINEHNAIIELSEMPSFVVSNTEFTQLFQNLVANAIKFAKKGVVPHVFINYISLPQNHRFEVKDNGIGIAPEYKESVFNIFERLHSHAEIKGSGIGLATCKKVVEHYKGKIWIESEVGVGTTIIFEIPK